MRRGRARRGRSGSWVGPAAVAVTGTVKVPVTAWGPAGPFPVGQPFVGITRAILIEVLLLPAAG